MSPAELLGGVILAALVCYALFAGADFGGGIWDLLATGPRRRAQRELVERAIGPIWEANHVWLILVVVVLFTAFPVAFAAISTTLFVPLTALLFGIVLRGAAFTFRAYDEGVAYRLETSLPKGEVKVDGEEVALNFAGDYAVYYPKEESFFSHNEREFVRLPLKDVTSSSLASLPAVVDARDGIKVAVAEADVDDYPGLWLLGRGASGLLGTFPPYPLQEELARDRDFKVTRGAENVGEFHKTERSVRTASSEQVRQPIYREGLDQWRNYEPWLGPLREALAEALAGTEFVIEAAPESTQAQLYRRLAQQVIAERSDHAAGEPAPLSIFELRQWAQGWGDRLGELEFGIIQGGAGI